jgi:hypothetical protein
LLFWFVFIILGLIKKAPAANPIFRLVSIFLPDSKQGRKGHGDFLDPWGRQADFSICPAFLSFHPAAESSLGGPRMKKQAIKKSANQWLRLPLSFSNTKEREAFLASVRQLDEQSDRLGILDPPETEPAVLYSPMEGIK